MLTKLKKRVQQMLSLEAKAAHKIGLTPNILSMIGFIFSLLSAGAYAISTQDQSVLLLSAVILLLSSGFCDMLDGILARTYQQASTFGGFLDSILDRYSDGIIFAGIIISGLCSIYAGLIALVGAFMVSYSRARAEALSIKMESIGLAERPERILILAATSVVAIFWLPALNIGVIILAVLSNFTFLQRGWHVYKKLKRENKIEN
jgi:archaetidylinositol phosphate synthase